MTIKTLKDIEEIEARAAAADAGPVPLNAFIAYARQDIPALCAALREAWAALGIPGVALYSPQDIRDLQLRAERAEAVVGAVRFVVASELRGERGRGIFVEGVNILQAALAEYARTGRSPQSPLPSQEVE